jgi:hypothetical protein
VPSKDGPGSNDLGQFEQARNEPGHPYQQGSVDSVQPDPVRRTSHGNIELMPKEQVLDFKLVPRLEQEVDDQRADQVENRAHRVR